MYEYLCIAYRSQKQQSLWLWRTSTDCICSLCLQWARDKTKAYPVQAWRDPECSRRWKFPDFKKIGTKIWQTCESFATATCTSQDIFLIIISVRRWVDPQDHSGAEIIISMNICNDKTGNRNRDFPTCSGISQPPAPPRSVWAAHGVFTCYLEAPHAAKRRRYLEVSMRKKCPAFWQMDHDFSWFTSVLK